MKISFPHFGCVTGYKKILEKFGHDVIVPKTPTRTTMELGVKYSPEFICFPFKVMLGTYIECAMAGAEVIVTSGGSGPCRAGMYSDIHQKILNDLGYKTQVIVFDSMYKDFSKFMEKIKMITGGKSILSILKTIVFGAQLVDKMDKLEKKLKILRAYEINFGEFNRAWNNIISDFDSCTTIKDVRHAYKCGLDTLTKIPIKDVPENEKIRVGIVGEIYVIMERSVNKNIEETLNTLGVEVENVQYTSDWVRDHLTPQWFPYPKVHRVAKLSDEVSPLNTGGHEKHNMGWIFDFKKRGFDGVVHLMPFACLPELVNLGKFPAISKELDMPILSLSLDEQLGEAHIKTRVEAFTDLIRSKHFMIEPVIQKPDDGAVKKPRVLVPEGEMSYAIKNAAKL